MNRDVLWTYRAEELDINDKPPPGVVSKFVIMRTRHGMTLDWRNVYTIKEAKEACK